MQAKLGIRTDSPGLFTFGCRCLSVQPSSRLLAKGAQHRYANSDARFVGYSIREPWITPCQVFMHRVVLMHHPHKAKTSEYTQLCVLDQPAPTTLFQISVVTEKLVRVRLRVRLRFRKASIRAGLGPVWLTDVLEG